MKAAPPPANRVPRPAIARFATALAGACLLAGAGLLSWACGPPDDSPRGLYRDHCARCHGLDGRGNPRAVKSRQGLDLERSELLARGDSPAVRQRIVEGEGLMPAFGDKLTPEQVEALVELSFELAGLEPPPPAAEIPEPTEPPTD